MADGTYRIGMVCAALLTASPALADDAPEKVTKILRVGDTTWRVTLKGDGATVQPRKTMFWKNVDAQFLADAKQAAEEASGCKVTDTNGYRMTIWATLDCDKPVRTD